MAVNRVSSFLNTEDNIWENIQIPWLPSTFALFPMLGPHVKKSRKLDICKALILSSPLAPAPSAHHAQSLHHLVAMTVKCTFPLGGNLPTSSLRPCKMILHHPPVFLQFPAPKLERKGQASRLPSVSPSLSLHLRALRACLRVCVVCVLACVRACVYARMPTRPAKTSMPQLAPSFLSETLEVR